MANSRDVEEIVSKLSSNKAKTREDGVKLLNSWLEGERSISFCRLLGRNTCRIRPDEIPRADTWPFLVTLLMKCVVLEKNAIKKTPPKLMWAKVLRSVIQHAEDPKFSGRKLFLDSVVKLAFNHAWEIIRDVPNFQLEYGIILRHLLSVKKYRLQMRKRIYGSLVLLYMKKVEELLMDENKIYVSSKEEAFRWIMTLYELLKSPPGDFPAIIREDTTKGFIRIGSQLREEGKVSRKLMDCINTFLLKDGPNLGSLAIEMHYSVHDFIFRYWLQTRDRGLKSAFILYAKTQLKLSRQGCEGPILEQLLEVIGKEFDDCGVSGGMKRYDASRDDIMGTKGLHHCLMELSAIVLYMVRQRGVQNSANDKRQKKSDAIDRLRDGLVRGNWLWNGTFYFLVCRYGQRMEEHLLTHLFRGICDNFERILLDSQGTQSYDGLLWMFWALQELCFILKGSQAMDCSSTPLSVVTQGWNVVWNSLMHGLPAFTNVTQVADAALVLLGNMVSEELVSTLSVPQEVWEVQIFKHKPSVCALYFVACYFARKGVQGNLHDVLFLRKSLLRVSVQSIHLKEPNLIDKKIAFVLPAAIFSLCVGYCPFPPTTMYHILIDEERKLLSDMEIEGFQEFSIEVIAKVDIKTSEMPKKESCPSTRLSGDLRVQLIAEMGQYLSSIRVDGETVAQPLSDVSLYCLFLCNVIFGLDLTGVGNEDPFLFSKLMKFVVDLLKLVSSIIEEKSKKLHVQGHWTEISGNSLSCLCCLVQCPLFHMLADITEALGEFREIIHQRLENLLNVLKNLMSDLLVFTADDDLTGEINTEGPSPTTEDVVPHFNLAGQGFRIVDMDLDTDDGPKDIQAPVTDRDGVFAAPFSVWEFISDLVSCIAAFSTVILDGSRQVLLNLLKQTSDAKVSECLFVSICKCFPPSGEMLSFLMVFVKNVLDSSAPCNLHYDIIITGIHRMMEWGSSKKGYTCEYYGHPRSRDTAHQFTIKCSAKLESQNIACLGTLVHKIGAIDLPYWSSRLELIECICGLISLDPSSGQEMIPMLLTLLQDPDYRVRLVLARRIGVLFQTWDGHEELLQDICSSFGVLLVMAIENKLVNVPEVLAAGSQCPMHLETALITLTHLSFYSDKVEVKYFEVLIGPLIYLWTTCNLSLASLLEVRDLFVVGAEPKEFLQLCCPWLITVLLIRDDLPNLNFVSSVSGQPLSVLFQKHFVHVFSICIALRCNASGHKETVDFVLSASILRVAEISECERDDLIRRHLVSIVSCLLSLTYFGSYPPMPFFNTHTITSAIQVVVDSFIERDNSRDTDFIIDKLNVFRPDRVFKFLLQMHYQITGAVHYRHRCHVLAGIGVLVRLLGHRSTISSTSQYIFNLVGNLMMEPALLEQCCDIISMMLSNFQLSSTNIVSILGEQLQLLASKLVACSIPDEMSEASKSPSPKVICLLENITLEADKALIHYIRELEPFPVHPSLEKIKSFHDELCRAKCPRDQLLKFVRKIEYLPQSFILWSLQSLSESFKTMTSVQPQMDKCGITEELNLWKSDPNFVSGVWDLLDFCGNNGIKDMMPLVADFISKVGIGDPHRIVFQWPIHATSSPVFSNQKDNGQLDEIIGSDLGVSEEVLVKIIVILKKHLLHDDVMVVDVTSRTLQGVLSTEMGQRCLSCFSSYDKSLLSVHSKGVNSELVERMLSDFRAKHKEDNLAAALWETHSKSYKDWICQLLQVLVSFSDDKLLSLCDDMASLSVEMAELLLPYVLVNISGKKDPEVDLCQIISMKVEENIFLETNDSVKSIQVFLNALNIVRSHQNAFVLPFCGRTSKHGKQTSSRTHSGQEILLGSLWKKVYWLAIDYLVVAKVAIHCGSYFTAVMYIEYWCEENFNCLELGSPDFSVHKALPLHIELLILAVTQINEPDSIYGIIQTYKLSSQIVTFEHEGKWSKALEYYDLLIRKSSATKIDDGTRKSRITDSRQSDYNSGDRKVKEKGIWRLHKGLMRSLQQIGCSHLLDFYFQGLSNQKCDLQGDLDFNELQYEAAWRSGNWDFTPYFFDIHASAFERDSLKCHFNERLHSCLRALHDGDQNVFHVNLTDAKQELVTSICNASKERTGYINSSIIKLQILDYLGLAWNLRWEPPAYRSKKLQTHSLETFSGPFIPALTQLDCMKSEWKMVLKQSQLHLDLLEPFIAFRYSLLRILNCKECTAEHLLEAASALRKGFRFSLASAAVHEFKSLFGEDESVTSSHIFSLGRIEEAKLLRAQGQHDMAINLARYIVENYQVAEDASNVHRLIGKWLVESRSGSSRTILEKYLKHSVKLSEKNNRTDEKSMSRKCKTHFNLAHYTDTLFQSYETRLTSNEWQAGLRLRKHKTKELDALIRRLKSSTKGDKIDYSVKIQELQKQLTMDREEAEKLQDDRDNFLSLALEGYQHCLSMGGKYDMRVVFRLISLWFRFPSRPNVLKSMGHAVNEIESHKFIPLVYQIASRLGSAKEGQSPVNFQAVLASLLKKMSIDHPYHSIYQLLALANGDRVKDKQRSRNSFIVDMDKKLAAENLLNELSSYHGPIIRQMKQMVDIYIKLAEIETKKEETNRRIPLPREIRSVRNLELVPVVTATFPVDPSCQYGEGFFPHFKGLGDSIMVMNGINAPKVVECVGSDGCTYRQLAKSGNDDLRQDAVMEQFFGLVNSFLQGNRGTWKRRLKIRTYKVIPFTPSAGVLEWVNQTVPLGEYLIGSSRNGGAHKRYRKGDWSFMQCREHMTNEKDKRKGFQRVYENFRPVLHHFFLERFLLPSNWFEKRLAYTRSVAASSMVGYIVGLGDRHSMNILIDQSTAEVVHIDLGVAFEQGLMLKTPERVPFRLTRDIVDGMGVTGVEGVFRRCCEETLSVMRTNKEALLTIVEVFIHDPLYKWALSPLKALRRQEESEEDTESSLEDSQDGWEGNKDAARALFRVKQKLDGYEDAEMRSVQGQVQQLIQDAIDTERLCQMFPGWGAWM
ncbi:serine/Threonine-kinase ATM-like protein isoform X2 [Wolffia australiana]